MVCLVISCTQNTVNYDILSDKYDSPNVDFTFSEKVPNSIRYEIYKHFAISYTQPIVLKSRDCIWQNRSIITSIDTVVSYLALDFLIHRIDKKNRKKQLLNSVDSSLYRCIPQYKGRCSQEIFYFTFINDTLQSDSSGEFKFYLPTERNIKLRHLTIYLPNKGAITNENERMKFLLDNEKYCNQAFTDTIRKYKSILNPWFLKEAERRCVIN